MIDHSERLVKIFFTTNGFEIQNPIPLTKKGKNLQRILFYVFLGIFSVAIPGILVPFLVIEESLDLTIIFGMILFLLPFWVLSMYLIYARIIWKKPK